MRPLTIVQLYPSELGINGDAGNVAALHARAHWRGIPVEVHSHNVGDTLPEHIDVVHIGSGPLSAQLAVHDDLMRIAERLRTAHKDGVPILAIAAGWQLLGRSLVTPDGETLAGVGVFASCAELSSRRFVGEIILTVDGLRVAGYENHSATTTLLDGAQALGTVVSGYGNTPDAPAHARSEGVRAGSSMGTALHGPLLPMNPALADGLLAATLTRRGDSGSLEPGTLRPTAQTELADGHAAKARAAIAQRLGVRG